ncbi:hypothetical protein, partial [Escherichia coli]|uniref:hypothetical protein n=1 Tax=Escherichia coli TaxID=562 RepID=UPI003D02B58B
VRVRHGCNGGVCLERDHHGCICCGYDAVHVLPGGLRQELRRAVGICDRQAADRNLRERRATATAATAAIGERVAARRACAGGTC